MDCCNNLEVDIRKGIEIGGFSEESMTINIEVEWCPNCKIVYSINEY